jgi:hypothetical protein
MEEEDQSMSVPTVTGAVSTNYWLFSFFFSEFLLKPKRRRGRPPKAAFSRVAGTGPATKKAAEGIASSSKKRKAASPESPPLCMPAKHRGGIMGSELGVSERKPENPEIEVSLYHINCSELMKEFNSVRGVSREACTAMWTRRGHVGGAKCTS